MKKINIYILFGLLLIFAGCSSSSNGGNPGQGNSDSVVLNSFVGGDNGLVVNFAEGSPPDKIRDSGSFPFSLRFLVENKGEFDIPEGQAFISIKGISPQDLGVDSLSKEIPSVRGVKKSGGKTLPGGRQNVIFPNLKYVQNLGVGSSFELNLNAFVCYPYRTMAMSSICLSGDTYQNYDDQYSTCKIESIRDVVNSGAPVKVENVQTMPGASDEVVITFDIVHKPTENLGRVFESGSLDSNCNIAGSQPSSSQAVLKEGVVKYKVETNVPGLTCSGSPNNNGEGVVNLYSDRASVSCTQKATGLDEQVKIFRITLDYDYLERVQKGVTVEHYGN